MSVVFFNPSIIGGNDTLPTFQLFQNWNASFSIPAQSTLSFWFGGNRESANLSQSNNQFITQGGFFTIKKLYLYHSPIFNQEDIIFYLRNISAGGLDILGQLTGILPFQVSIITCEENFIQTTRKYNIEVENSQVANVFSIYQITALCETYLPS